MTDFARRLSLLIILGFAQLGLAADKVETEERPNILWIVSEDNSFDWLACYGNKQALTPNLDQLAASGIRYTHAYSNGAVCAVARFTLLTGICAPACGTQNMRSRYPIPAGIETYPDLLRKAGYYCVNHSKTDYNYATEDTSHWDASSPKASWRGRKPGQPFFAVFNSSLSHESSLFTRGGNAAPLAGTHIAPQDARLPPYLPDTPEIRRDWVRYLDVITRMDAEVGLWLKQLADDGLTDDTIVVYCSDHGGILPRSKRYLYDSGTHVPLIFSFPKKWAHLAPGKAGSSDDRTVAFVDLTPSLLALAGVPKPAQMSGRVFLGPKAESAAPYAFLYAQRFDENMFWFGRGLSDGHYRYLLNFFPHRSRGIFGGYPHGQPGWESFCREHLAKRTSGPQESFWTRPQPVDELYCTDSDPNEVKNLAAEAAQQERLATFRKALLEQMRNLRDTGVVPEMMYADISRRSTVRDYVQNRDFPYDAILELAENAARRQVPAADITALLGHAHPVIRYWAATAAVILGEEARPAIPALTTALSDTCPAVRIAAAEALLQLGDKTAATQTMIDILATTPDEIVALEAFTVVRDQELVGAVPAAALEHAFATGDYMKLLRGKNPPAGH